MLAYGHVFLSSAFLFAHALKGWAVLYPEFQLQPFVNAYHLAVLFALTVIPYTFITIVPAWRAAVTDPERVMTQG
jgi:ABC-type lipoprotein release transport system permease subunit